VAVGTVLNVLRNDIGDILDEDEPSHCICIDCTHFNLSDCSGAQCPCCLDRCGLLYRNKDSLGMINENKQVRENAAIVSQ
jgi:hypothetical protein